MMLELMMRTDNVIIIIIIIITIILIIIILIIIISIGITITVFFLGAHITYKCKPTFNHNLLPVMIIQALFGFSMTSPAPRLVH